MKETKRLVLNHVLRYNWIAKTECPTALKAVYEPSSLAFQTNDMLCKGKLLANVGSEKYFYAELCCEPDKVSREATRFCPENIDAQRAKPVRRECTPPRHVDKSTFGMFSMYMGLAIIICVLALFMWAFVEDRGRKKAL